MSSDGALDAFPPGRRFPAPVRLRLRVGTPLNFADVPDARRGWEEIAARPKRRQRVVRTFRKQTREEEPHTKANERPEHAK